jgi:hypothetical protein
MNSADVFSCNSMVSPLVLRITATAVADVMHSFVGFISGTGSSTNAGVDTIESR